MVPRYLIDQFQLKATKNATRYSRGPEVSDGDLQSKGSRVSTSAHMRVTGLPKNCFNGGLGQETHYSEFISDSEMEAGK